MFNKGGPEPQSASTHTNREFLLLLQFRCHLLSRPRPSQIVISNHAPIPNQHPSIKKTIYSALVGPLESFGAPVWNPFLNLRETPLRYRMRPVPVVLRLFAFSPQLSIYHVSPEIPALCCRGDRVVSWGERTSSDLSSWITAGCASMLLDVERSSTYSQ